MKKFKQESLHFGDVQPPLYFTENQPPSWLGSKEHLWWFKGHVLELEVGCSIDSDFSKITRLEDGDE